MNDFFLRFEPDPWGLALGTGYQQFEHSSGMIGLAKMRRSETELATYDRLDILAVMATCERQGQFRELIADAKRSFRTVAVWEDMNPIVGPALERYGFKPAQCVEAWGEVSNGWEWSFQE